MSVGQGPSGQAPGQQGSAGNAVDQAKAKTGDVVDQVKQTAGQVVDQAKQTATAQVSDRKDMAADSLGAVADTLRQTSQQLRDQNVGPFVGVADAAASRIEGVSSYLRETDVNDMLRDVEDLGRRQPALFLAGALGLGLLAARFVKSSAPAPEWDDEAFNRRFEGESRQGLRGGQYGGGQYGTGQYGGGQYSGSQYGSTSGRSSTTGQSSGQYRSTTTGGQTYGQARQTPRPASMEEAARLRREETRDDPNMAGRSGVGPREA